jgi:protein gp37
MSMNKTKIEWCDYTWSPVTGCKHGCPYCYARKIAERFKGSKAWPQGFEPMFHEERLNDPRKLGTKYYCPYYMAAKGTSIFVCSMADLFGEWVPQEWIHRVFLSCHQTPRHTYIFLTKNPARIESLSVHSCFEEFMNSKNAWFGTSITGEEDSVDRLGHLIASDLPNRFISFEPLLKYPFDGDQYCGDLTGIKQVIIGAQTNPDIRPEYDAVLNICEAADRVSAKVFMKDSLAKWFPDRELRRELCWSVRK